MRNYEVDSLQLYREKMYEIAKEKITLGMEVIDPWAARLSPYQRAEYHLWLLAKTYGEGHPGSQNSIEEVASRQQSGELLTWIVTWHDQPVGMVNLAISADGIAEVVRSVALPEDTELPNGEHYHGQANISAAMYQRLADLIGQPDIRKQIRLVEGDVRLAREIILPTGERLPSGERTQHINAVSGLCPLLLCVPRYQVHPRGGVPHQEAFLQSRKYLADSAVHLNEPLYIPIQSDSRRIGLSEIAQVTYEHGWGVVPEIIDGTDTTSPPGSVELVNAAGIHYAQMHIRGDVDCQILVDCLKTGLSDSRFVEIILENHQDNLEVQKKLQSIQAVVPLGVLPGDGEYPTTLHYGVARPDIVDQMVEIQFARDYQNTALESITHALREEWRQSGGLQ